MDTLIKQPNESILYTMNFDGVGGIGNGDAVAAVSSATSNIAGLAITQLSHDNKSNAKFRIAGGTNGEKHKVTVQVNTVLGDILESEGFLKIVDK